MRRRLPLLAEVGLGFHDAASEVVVPELVHHHAGGERMVGAGQRAHKGQPVAAGFTLRVWQSNRIGLSGWTNPDFSRMKKKQSAQCGIKSLLTGT